MVDLDFLARKWKIILGGDITTEEITAEKRGDITTEEVTAEKAWTVLKDAAWRWKFPRTLDDMLWLNQIHPRDDPTAICDYPQTN